MADMSHTQRLEAALDGKYRIERKLGEGGMASVYLAEDIKHERKVALKILKPELAAVIGAERFLSEIKTTANLQHPHILALFDSGEADGYLYYVMPYIEGETLRERIEREQQLGVDESVRIARDVADALDYAHRAGVIHRDIKPANILLHDGRPVVADFGIALAISAAGGGRMTETGLSLGTPHYMSPEQASADRDLSARSDVYSLGCVLYEMLAGQPPHTGPSAQSILVRILTEDPRDVTELRRTVPANVAATVMKSIEKLPADRFDSAKDFMEALQDAEFSYSAPARPKSSSAKGAATTSTRVNPAKAVLPWATVAVMLVVAAFGWLRSPAVPDTAPATRLSLDMDGHQLFVLMAAVSPDGSRFAVPSDEGLMLREGGQPGWRLLAGTEGAYWPTFSPDGEWIAYETPGGNLYKIAVTGSSPLTLVDIQGVDVNRPHWGETGTIVFSNGVELWQVSATGGDAAPVSDDTALGQYPNLLPDGSGIVSTNGNDASLQLYDFASGETTTLQPAAVDGMYVRTGHILYAHPAGGLFALPFDLSRHEVTGAPIPVLGEVMLNALNAWYTISRNGTLAFGTGWVTSTANEIIVLRDTVGGADTVRLSPRALQRTRFSPDGSRLLLGTAGGRGTDERQIYTYDLVRESLNQLTFDKGHQGVWSPDGTEIAFSAARDGTVAEDLFVQLADGSQEARHILAMEGDQHAADWPNDSSLVFEEGGDVYTVSPTETAAPASAATAYAQAEFGEFEISISPSGTYAAYVSNETGREEVFVRDFPEPRGKWRISADGGRQPRWSADGASVYYMLTDEDAIVRTRIRTDPSIAPLDTEVMWSVPGLQDWDLDRNTGRALVVVRQGEEEPNGEEGITVIVNWFDELLRLTGGN